MDVEPSLQEMRAIMKNAREMLEVATFPERIREVTKQLNELADSKVVKATKNFGNMFKGMAKASFQTAALSMLMEILQPLIDLFMMFTPIFQAVGLLLQSVFLPVFEDMLPFIKLITNAIISVIPYAKQLWDIIKLGLVVAFQAIINVIKLVVDVIVGSFMFVWNSLVNAFRFIRALYDTTIAVVWNLMVAAFTFVRDLARAVVNVIIDIINGVMNTLTLGFWADIPHFAKGGIVTQPTVAGVGEVPEAIIPLDQAGSMLGGRSEEYLSDLNDKVENLIVIQQKQARMTRRRFG